MVVDMRDGMHTFRCRGGVKMAAGIVIAVIMLLSCDRLMYPFRPFVHSTALFGGSVYDSLSKTPIASATVRIGGNGDAATTDADGAFRFDETPTGRTVVVVTAAGFREVTMAVDITLEPSVFSCSMVRPNAPPEIDTVVIDSSGMEFFDDPLTINFRAVDSSGGIVAVRLITGDTGDAARLELRPAAPTYALVDSFIVHYPAAARWSACIEIIGARGDTSRDSFTIGTLRPKRPAFVLLRTQGGFQNGVPGYLQATVDADDKYARMSIDWGDGSVPEVSYARQGTYWHRYRSDGDTLYGISIRLFCVTGATVDSTISAMVSKVNPPLLDGRLYFEPSQYCAPHDTALLIGVRVLDVEGWVEQIVWIVNENDPAPAFAYERDTLGAIRGKLPDSASGLFVHRFSTAGFKGVNDVRIMVVDRYGEVSSVSGSFYIAGKPGG